MHLEAYEEGKRNAEFHIANCDALSREANASLSILMAAGLGATGYAAHLIEQGAAPALVAAVGGVALHLLTIGALMVRRCLAAADLEPPTNEPLNLVHPGFTWEQIIEAELANLATRIDFNYRRNRQVGKWLNGLRYAAFASPITFVVVLAAARAMDARAHP